jgi:hypothetical protein
MASGSGDGRSGGGLGGGFEAWGGRGRLLRPREREDGGVDAEEERTPIDFFYGDWREVFTKKDRVVR